VVPGTFLLRAAVVWLVLMAAEVLHGALRTLLLALMVGDFLAGRIGGDLRQELNTRWLEITQRVLAIQHRLQQHLAGAGTKPKECIDRLGGEDAPPSGPRYRLVDIEAR
jgi:hypothetical protein